uniref:FBD domain-containing protein n=1 Tax=Setaria digitata TaxID=48799 RepID=A0A915PGI3_9BILA
MVNSFLKSITKKDFNVTFQFEIVRAVEAVSRGRLELTIWSHEFWYIPELLDAKQFWSKQNWLKLRLNSRTELEFSPEMILKNALYFKEHRTPLLNTILEIRNDGFMVLHSLYTLDIPCTKIIPTQSKCIKYELCGVEIVESQYESSVSAVCELHYGSLIYDNNQIILNWATSSFHETNMACSVELLPRCVITRIRRSKRETTFVGQKYDELVACIVLSFPTRDSVLI